MTLSRRTLLALGGGAMLATGAVAQSPLAILARFPNGTFLENLVVEPGGRVIFTNYFAKRLESWSPAGGHVPWAEVAAHPVSLTALDGGRHAVAVHGVSFMDGPQAMRGQTALLVLAADGTVARRIALPEAVFPNGGLLLGGERLLLADSILGRIWLVDLGTGEATTWLAHSSLAPDPAQPYPGANGMKRAGDWLLVSNSATRQLLRVRLAGSQPQGAPELLARMTGGVDDFAVARDGTIYAATHGVGLARLQAGAATPVEMAAPGVEGSTAVALTPDGRALYALGTGGLATGGRGEAVLARLELGAPG
jgi:sugar lactone lactonase YvrE